MVKGHERIEALIERNLPVFADIVGDWVNELREQGWRPSKDLASALEQAANDLLALSEGISDEWIRDERRDLTMERARI